MEITQGVRFDTLGLSAEVMRALEKKNYEVSTPIQAGCIPPMLDWQDVTAKAPTGTGKTFAFGIPIIEHIDIDSDQVQAVVLAPTRELAMQITSEMRDLAQFKPGIRMVCLYGGQPIGRQIDALKKRPQIVVATPGRLQDHMKRRTVRIDSARTAILDEADRMLDMGFIHDVTKLLDQMKNRKNLGLFSATISREVMDIAWVYQRDPVEVTVRAEEENKPDILQYRLEVTMNEKVDTVAKILELEQYDRVMIFCNTKGNTERVTKLLQMRGVDAQCIHGDIPQEKREKVMARFRRGELRVFVATDVAARGIDVDDVDAVFNYDVPDENEYYVHRIGRTGRAKRRGAAYTLVTDYPGQVRLNNIAKHTKNDIRLVAFGEDGQLVPVEGRQAR
ncbi:MAG: DEAD/DEAH box helicase [Oscillospiraceae bacterium]|jgi:ATP-dependent RNA helicase DeaD|nr:DEAD/DEAH box helicase [Oscillospiraceae bacterium]